MRCSPKHHIHLVRPDPLLRRQHVGIRVLRYGRLRMAHGVRDHADRDAVAQCQRGVRVAQVVEPNNQQRLVVSLQRLNFGVLRNLRVGCAGGI